MARKDYSKSKNDLIFQAYLNGWSRTDTTKIFNVSDRRVITATKQATFIDKQIHKDKNKERNNNFKNALDGWKNQYQNINGKKPTRPEISKMRKEFRQQSINGAKGSYGTTKKYSRPKITTWTAFLEEEY